jgi:hypothetical protein
MGETKKYLSVRSMSKYQHYKINKPRWIKIYESLWHDHEFFKLSDASKAHLIGIFVLCSQHNNIVPFEDEWIAKCINASEKINWDSLLASDYIVVNEDVKENLYKKYRTPLGKRSIRVEESRVEESRVEESRVDEKSGPKEDFDSKPNLKNAIDASLQITNNSTRVSTDKE